MSTAFDKIGSDRQLQDHWLRRLIAGIIDSIIISIIVYIISVFAALPAVFLGGAFYIAGFPFIQGILLFLYAAFLESVYGTTIGKQIMLLRVQTLDGKLPSFERTLIRDVSKIHGLLWLIDTLIGMATIGDPHQKYSDRFARTTVVSTTERSYILSAEQGSPAPPTPPST